MTILPRPYRSLKSAEGVVRDFANAISVTGTTKYGC